MDAQEARKKSLWYSLSKQVRNAIVNAVESGLTDVDFYGEGDAPYLTYHEKLKLGLLGYKMSCSGNVYDDRQMVTVSWNNLD